MQKKADQFWVAAAEREDAGRYIVQADQELPAFFELESAIKTHRHNHECDCPEPAGVGAASQRLIPAGARSGLQTRTNDGKRFVVRADENLSIAKALRKERQPRHGAIALRLPTGYSA
jgi:hypothetical protein